MKTWTLHKPVPNHLALMRAVVVHDDMNVQFGRYLAVNVIEKFTKFNGSMALVCLTQNPSKLNIERSKQRCRSVPFVIMRASFRLTRLHRQQWCRAIQCLNLRFFINAQNYGMFRRIDIEANNIANLFDQQRIVRQFESFASLGLQCVFRRKPPLMPIERHHRFRRKASSNRSAATLER